MPGGEVLRFDLPPTAAVANLTGAATGIRRMVARPPAESTATVIDTADHRLLDWGIELSRIVETGQWVLRAPGWVPPLQAETVSPQAEDELPPELADVLVPFRRGGILGPKLKVETLRRRFSLAGDDLVPFGELTDERHRVLSHAGQVTSYRDVTLRIPAPSVDQVQAITAAFVAAGGTVVDGFAALASRLGLAHQSQRRSALSARAPIEEFVAAQFESRWRRLLLADLAARTGSGDDAALREGVQAVGVELAGLEPLLQSAWVHEAEQRAATAAESTRPLQHTVRWLRLLDVVAQGATAPPLGPVAGRITGPVLAQELEALVQTVLDQCRTLAPYSDDARWVRARQVTARALALSTLARDVFGKPAKQLRRCLEPVVDALSGTIRPDPASLTRDLHNLSTAEVFEAGRAYERTVLTVDYERQNFVRDWPAWGERVRARMIRPRVPHVRPTPVEPLVEPVETHDPPVEPVETPEPPQRGAR